MKNVGKSVPRVDGNEKVTGSSSFVTDVSMPNTLWMKFLRSSVPHARILNLDVKEALLLPGVHAILTGEDVEGIRGGNLYADEPILASWDKVRFVGDKIAAIAGENKDVVEEAIKLIKVQYEELPAVFDPVESMKHTSPILHEEFNEYRGVQRQENASNLYQSVVSGWGDIDLGMKEADVVVEKTYNTTRVHQGYLEPHACTVWIDSDENVQVWMSSQMPTGRRPHLARMMGVPREKLVINYSNIGGSFGGKMDATGVVASYLLAKKANRPVKFIMDYSEEFTAMNPRHPSSVKVKVGARFDGSLIAWEASGVFATGAYAAYAPVGELGGMLSTAMVEPYLIPNVQINSHQVYTNTVPGGYVRGPGMMQSVFASESIIDVLAAKLNMDPFDLRMKNFIKNSGQVQENIHWVADPDPESDFYQTFRLSEMMDKAAKSAGYFKPKAAYTGRGISVHGQSDSGYDTPVTITAFPDGKVVVNTMIYDPGMGTGTILAQIVSDELQINIGRIDIEHWSTKAEKREYGVAGQRGTRVASRAGYEASQKIKTNLKRLAAEFLGWTEESIVLRNGALVNQISNDEIKIEEIVLRSGSNVKGEAVIDEGADGPLMSFAVHIAEVSVDPYTGEIEVMEYTAVHETGKIINPQGFRGQMQGAIVQGLGHTLMEELVINNGTVLNPSFADYKIPTEKDVPKLNVIPLESETGYGPLKVRGIGDTPIVLVAPAIANAIADALDQPIESLPIKAADVYDLLKSKL